jgi:hypothetical protein
MNRFNLRLSVYVAVYYCENDPYRLAGDSSFKFSWWVVVGEKFEVREYRSVCGGRAIPQPD